MLTSITLQNFKGIGEEITIPIRPLTIMFGKNSAGKSTVVQALHYAREVLLHNNPNADRTALGGTSIDLGGFLNIVHNHDLSKPIMLRFEFTVDALPSYNSFWQDHFLDVLEDSGLSSGDDEYKAAAGARDVISQHQGESFAEEMFREKGRGDETAATAGVEIIVHWSETLQRAIVTRYLTWLGDDPAGMITTSLDGASFDYSINLDNRFFCNEEEPTGPDWISDVLVPLKQSLPNWGQGLEIVPHSDGYDRMIGTQTVSEMIVAPGDILIELLSELRYIGPLRETPPRNFQPPNQEDESTWANGTGAWARLYKGGDILVGDVGEQLSSSYLKTGYVLVMERFREIPLDSKLMLALQLGSVLDSIDDTAVEVKKFPIKERLMIVEENSGLKLMPNDIGVGISQIVPVVVAAVDSFHKVIAIEQPELHLHPAVQAELGDLLITSAREHENTFFIETHSEHLILRVLRRIRETENEEDTGNSSKIYPDDVSLVYVEPTSDGTQILSIPITTEGDLEKNVPGGFFAERAKELF